ncbi:MAG: hypothetical protein JNL98_27130 [Bryobacterales bacterium]|nr:hypothetical protein [Bryobacterales bacterium]
MAWDPIRQEIVAAGAGETWTWNGTNWTKKTVSIAIPEYVRMAWDPIRGEIVAFGGSAGGAETDKTWTWNGSDWTEKTPATKPPARLGTAMAFDAASGKVVMFGGQGLGGVPLNDTWTWNGTNWTLETPATSPPASSPVPCATHDAVANEVILSCGVGGTWAWTGNNWVRRITTRVPPEPIGAAMAFRGPWRDRHVRRNLRHQHQ